MKNTILFISILFLLLTFPTTSKPKDNSDQALTYKIPDTGQSQCFNDRLEIPFPGLNDPFSGQDAQYETNTPAFRNNGDGTITDLNTGLMWQKTPDFIKRNLKDSEKYADSLTLAGHNDWRLPTIKELFSIADFNGNIRTQTPYIDTRYFDFKYPEVSRETRIIDAQYRSSTRYPGAIMHGTEGVFGFNFADGRIKAYPVANRRGGLQYVRCVRGNAYGQNKFKDNGDETVTDLATSLTWMKTGSNKKMTWQEALDYAENLNHAGHNDWRLPDIKELQSIVDYNRAPDARSKNDRSAAIDPVFNVAETESWYWSSTTHLENGGAYYVCFGQAFSKWNWRGKQMNAHGAGAVRSDPKTGNPDLYPNGKGPQGDEIRIYNYARCVRGGDVKRVNQENNRFGNDNNHDTPGPHPGPQGNERFSNDNSSHPKRFIARLDKDRDGKVSRSEFDGPAHHFNTMDRNKDGFISEQEAPKHPPGRRMR